MDDRVDAEILALCGRCQPGRSISPEEVARALTPEDGDWRRMLARVRTRAIALARAGRIEILRKGRPVERLDDLRGVIRLRAR